MKKAPKKRQREGKAGQGKGWKAIGGTPKVGRHRNMHIQISVMELRRIASVQLRHLRTHGFRYLGLGCPYVCFRWTVRPTFPQVGTAGGP